MPEINIPRFTAVRKLAPERGSLFGHILEVVRTGTETPKFLAQVIPISKLSESRRMQVTDQLTERCEQLLAQPLPYVTPIYAAFALPTGDWCTIRPQFGEWATERVASDKGIEASESDRTKLATQLVTALAGLHNAGLYFGDLQLATALRLAIEARQPVGSELLHHSDRGCQYTSDVYQQTLRTLGITCSMSRTGECYDNAVMERFFWSLKNEWTNHAEFADEAAARMSVFKYIETFYNSERIHQTLGYKTPNQFETEYAPVAAA